MKERPILFSGPMVRALLEGRKTQTRRVVKPQPPANFLRGDVAPITDGELWAFGNSGLGGGERGAWPADPAPGFPCPYGQPGDRLIVKEHAWMWCEKIPNGTTKTGRLKFKYEPFRYAQVFYCSDHPEKPKIGVVAGYRGYEWGWRKKLGRFLPKWASRITLNVTAVHVERLQDISDADAVAEGVEDSDKSTARMSYAALWESINGPGSWDANPWVWVISFRRSQP